MDEDKELVARAQQGHEDGVVRLYRKYSTPIFRYVMCRLPSRESAEDVTSDVFLVCIQGLSRFQGNSSFRTWLYAIARRKIADFWRQTYRLPEVAIDVVDLLIAQRNAPSHDEPEPEHKRVLDLQSVLAALSERDRRVLECRFLEGKTIDETASALNLTTSNVKVIQHRAIAKAAQHAQSL